MSAPTVPALAFATGLGVGVAVTWRLHQDPEAGGWGARVGRTRLRVANIPVGGSAALAASLLLPRRAAVATRALGAGAIVGAVGWGIADPLPSLEPS